MGEFITSLSKHRAVQEENTKSRLAATLKQSNVGFLLITTTANKVQQHLLNAVRL